MTIAVLPVPREPGRRLRHRPPRRHRPGRRLRREAARPTSSWRRCARRRSGWSAAASRPTAGSTWPAWASTCSTARRCSTCSTPSRWRPTSARRSSRAASRRHHVQAHLFDGYWEDLGTIKSYHEANLALASDDPPFDFHSPEGVIYTRMRYLPASRVSGASLEQCLISDGCVVAGRHAHRALRHRRPQPDRPQRAPCATRSSSAPTASRPTPSGPATGSAACPTWASATARSSSGPSSTRIAASAATCTSSTAKGVQDDEGEQLRHPRRHRGHPQGGGGAGWDGDLNSSLAVMARGLERRDRACQVYSKNGEVIGGVVCSAGV